MAAAPSGARSVVPPRAAADERESPASLAPTAADWHELGRRAALCTACSELAAERTQVVVGVWPPGADVLFVGEAPGASEDARGLPFVGRSGMLLDRLLADAGMPRETVAVCNILKCRPPNNRKPKRAEVDRCTPWLVRQVELIDPLLICALGGTSAEWALGRAVRLADLRGQVHRSPRLGDRQLVATYHPSAALRGGPNSETALALGRDLRWVVEVAERLRRERAAAAGELEGDRA